MSKVTSRDKDARSSGTATSSASTTTKAKPSSSSLSSGNHQPRSDAKGTATVQAGTSFVASKPVAEFSAPVSKNSGVHDMRAHEWKNFFLDSGIPDHAAAEYATIFVKERINWHILKNLDKGYLTDMGINCIGDQIAILQAAKKYCGEQYAPGHPKAAAAVPHQPAPRMDVEEVHGTSNGASAAHVALNRAPEVPEKVVVMSTISRLSPKKPVRAVTSANAMRSVVQNPRNPSEPMGTLRGKRSAEDDDERLVMKKVSAQPARQVRMPPDDTTFTVRLGAGAGVRRGDVFSRLSQKGVKSSNNNLVRVLESRMSRLSTGAASAMPSNNGSAKPTLVSDNMAVPTSIHKRLGSNQGSSRTQSAPSSRAGQSAGSTVFSRLGYQSKAPRNDALNPNGDSRTKLSVHDRLGTRR